MSQVVLQQRKLQPLFVMLLIEDNSLVAIGPFENIAS